ncbi:MAG: sulfatase-like hydrolase/transferase [Planctomycetia bacterium]
MQMSVILRTAAVIAALGVAGDAWAKPPARPNVVVVVADDAGWGDFSFVGNRSVATPAVDSLAHDGAVLEQFCVQPVCSPTTSPTMRSGSSKRLDEKTNHFSATSRSTRRTRR